MVPVFAVPVLDGDGGPGLDSATVGYRSWAPALPPAMNRDEWTTIFGASGAWQAAGPSWNGKHCRGVHNCDGKGAFFSSGHNDVLARPTVPLM